MRAHFLFLFSIYSENHGVKAEQLNFSRSSDITYVPEAMSRNRVRCDIVYTIAFVTNESMCSTENMEKYPKNIAFAFWYFQGLRKKTLFGSQNGK